MRTLEIAVQPDIASIISYYQQIKVYKAATYDGTFVAVGSPIALVSGQSLYPFVDNTGLLTDVYRFSYYRTLATVAESNQYDLPVYYFTITALKARIDDGQASPDDDRNFIDAAAAATDAVNRYCGRRFNQVIETRYFEGSPSQGFYIGKGAQILMLDDFVSISAISATYSGGATAINPSTGVYLLPENAPRVDWPYTSLKIIPAPNQDYSLGGYWPTGYHAIAITGAWGWPLNPYTQSTVPAGVKEAAMEIALRLYMGKQNGYSNTIGQTDLGTQKVDDGLMSKNVMGLLEKYVRKY